MASPGVGGTISAASDVTFNNPVQDDLLMRDGGYWKNMPAATKIAGYIAAAGAVQTALDGRYVRTVNGTAPDAAGNVSVAGGSGAVPGAGQALLVASSEAAQLVKDRADYVCTGTNDQATINAALAALPGGGGMVMLSSGNFNLTAPVMVIGHGQTLAGTGTGARASASQPSVGTRLIVSAGFAGTEIVRVQLSANTAPAHGVTLRDFTVDGNSVGSNIDGVLFRSHTAAIEHVHVHRCTGNGIKVLGYASPAWATYDTVISGCIISNNGAAGVWLANMAQDDHIIGCVIFDNQDGIRVSAGSQQITASHTYGNARYNVWFDGSGSRTKIVNLKCEGAGQHGIYVDGTSGTGLSDLMIIACNFKDNGRSVDNTYDHLHFVGPGTSSRPIITNNAFSWTTGNKPRYGICFASANSASNVQVQGNTFVTTLGTGPVSRPFTLTGAIRDNIGYSGPDDAYVMVGDGSSVKKIWFGGATQPAGMSAGDYWIHDA